ncbi:MAG: hypothetical protein ACSHX0_14025 [Akkermansiaceae bacterium]
MKNETPPQAIAFPPRRYTKKVLAMILSKAEEWKVTPLKAESRLLDQLANKKTGQPAV